MTGHYLLACICVHTLWAGGISRSVLKALVVVVVWMQNTFHENLEIQNFREWCLCVISGVWTPLSIMSRYSTRYSDTPTYLLFFLKLVIKRNTLLKTLKNDNLKYQLLLHYKCQFALLYNSTRK